MSDMNVVFGDTWKSVIKMALVCGVLLSVPVSCTVVSIHKATANKELVIECIKSQRASYCEYLR